MKYLHPSFFASVLKSSKICPALQVSNVIGDVKTMRSSAWSMDERDCYLRPPWIHVPKHNQKYRAYRGVSCISYGVMWQTQYMINLPFGLPLAPHNTGCIYVYLICAWCNVVVNPIQYIKPTMTGAGWNPTHKHGDNLGMVMTLGLSHYYIHTTPI